MTSLVSCAANMLSVFVTFKWGFRYVHCLFKNKCYGYLPMINIMEKWYSLNCIGSTKTCKVGVI